MLEVISGKVGTGSALAADEGLGPEPSYGGRRYRTI